MGKCSEKIGVKLSAEAIRASQARSRLNELEHRRQYLECAAFLQGVTLECEHIERGLKWLRERQRVSIRSSISAIKRSSEYTLHLRRLEAKMQELQVLYLQRQNRLQSETESLLVKLSRTREAQSALGKLSRRIKQIKRFGAELDEQTECEERFAFTRQLCGSSLK